MTNKTLKLKLAWFYPELMSTYGDAGNIEVLFYRAKWAGIEMEVEKIELKDNLKKTPKIDLLFMGGAQDRQQSIVLKDLLNNKGAIIEELLYKEKPALFVCAAYQLMGQYYITAEGEAIEGLKILDLYTENPGFSSKRLVGDIVISSPLFPDLKILGFENHGGRTYLGKNIKPFGKVLLGNGNNGLDNTEGALFKNLIASYLHGPLLPKNPKIADWLIEKALEVKYKEKFSLNFPNEVFEKTIREIQIEKIAKKKIST